tara:strand:- start:160 stop:324 length:165 start_codon:yes stop_codon:yes gene_type:complete
LLVAFVSFEIVETILNSGAGSLFNKTTTRKYVLRGACEELSVDWQAIIKEKAKQ